MRVIVSIDTQRRNAMPARRLATAAPGQSIFVMTAEALAVRTSRHAEAVVVEVRGEIDRATAPILDRAIDLVATIAQRVVVNLSEASYLDSSTLNSLIRAHGRLAARQVPLIVVKPADPNIAKLFDLTRLPAALALVESLDDALTAGRQELV